MQTHEFYSDLHEALLKALEAVHCLSPDSLDPESVQQTGELLEQINAEFAEAKKTQCANIEKRETQHLDQISKEAS